VHRSLDRECVMRRWMFTCVLNDEPPVFLLTATGDVIVVEA
jgi:hypothetical protein